MREVSMRVVPLLGLGVLAALVAGCRGSLPVSAPAMEPPPRWPSAPLVERELVGRSVEGRPIESVTVGDGPVTVLVIASIHGDESAGTWIVRELVDRLVDQPVWLAGRKLVAVPVVNPDGLAAGTRHNARGVDLNRDFPASNQRRPGDPPTEPESRALLALIERERPARIVSFHQAANRLDFDGPAQGLAEAMAAVCPLEVAPMGARPGSLGSWAGVDRRIPIVTVELPREADDQLPSRRWELYGEMLLVAVRYPESWPGGPRVSVATP
jgi:protein MpaA